MHAVLYTGCPLYLSAVNILLHKQLLKMLLECPYIHVFNCEYNSDSQKKKHSCMKVILYKVGIYFMLGTTYLHQFNFQIIYSTTSLI